MTENRVVTLLILAALAVAALISSYCFKMATMNAAEATTAKAEAAAVLAEATTAKAETETAGATNNDPQKALRVEQARLGLLAIDTGNTRVAQHDGVTVVWVTAPKGASVDMAIAMSVGFITAGQTWRLASPAAKGFTISGKDAADASDKVRAALLRELQEEAELPPIEGS